MSSNTDGEKQWIIGQYARVIGMAGRWTVGAVGDGRLFVGGKWWPTWLVVAA